MSDEVAARESQSATLTTDLSGSEGVSEWLRPAAHQKLLGALCHSHTHSLPPSLACPTHCPIQGLPPTPACSTLRLHGWRYEAALSVDRNHMNLACLLARNSNCTDGHMACVLVRGIPTGQGECVLDGSGQEPGGEVVHVPEVVLGAINTSLFADKLSSDVHAEANAIAEAARCGLSLQGTSIYVTMPPCKNCYKLVAAAGVRRIVTRRNCCSPEALRHMAQVGIEFVQLEETAAHLAALDAYSQPHVDRTAVEQERLRRKLVKAAAKENSRLKRARKEQEEGEVAN